MWRASGGESNFVRLYQRPARSDPGRFLLVSAGAPSRKSQYCSATIIIPPHECARARGSDAEIAVPARKAVVEASRTKLIVDLIFQVA